MYAMSGFVSSMSAFMSTMSAKDVAMSESLSAISGLTKNKDMTKKWSASEFTPRTPFII